MFVHLVDDNPVIKTMRDFKQENPNVSLPKDNLEDALVGFGYYPLTFGDIPEYDPSTHKFVNATAPVLENDVWVLKKEIVELTAEQKVENDAIQAKTVRAQRTKKLEETDYLALSDVVISDEMKTYRQALRDITAQEGFPWNVIWPEKP